MSFILIPLFGLDTSQQGANFVFWLQQNNCQFSRPTSFWDILQVYVMNDNQKWDKSHICDEWLGHSTE